VAERIPIVVAAPPMRTGGTEQHLLHILPALAERGFDITAVLLLGGGALEGKLSATAVRVVAPTHERDRPLRTALQALAIRRIVQETGARVLHAFLSEPYLAAYAAHASLIGRKPALVHGRRSLAFYGDAHPLARRAERLAHRSAARLVGNSTAVADELIAESDAPRKVVVIHNGIPRQGAVTPAERAAARLRFGLPENALVLTMVANFHPYKGHAKLIAALAAIAQRLPQPWRLLLPGRDGGVLNELRAQIAGAGLAANIIMPGEWHGSREPYAAADVGLLVSRTEGFSNALIEGMAAGLPMIATAVGGNLDAIADGSTGVLVQVGDAAALAEAIQRLAEDTALRTRIGGSASAMAEARFSLEACVDGYERLWRELAS
jgi:glycosyltransferase involved in cell wall biosynthesis